MQFKLREGPWNTIFSGTFQEHETEILSNQESIFLVVVYDKEKGKIQGAVLEAYRIFSVEGETEAFVDTLLSELIFFSRHEKGKTLKYFALSSKPEYVDWKEEELSAITGEKAKELKEATESLKDTARAYDIKVKELHKAGKEEKEAFFSQTLVPMLLSSSRHTTEAKEEKPAIQVSYAEKGEIVLGISRDSKEKIEEPIEFFQQTIVSGSQKKDRILAVQILMEAAMLSNASAIVFDLEEKFQNLSSQTKDRQKLKEFQLDIEPIGFPVKEFKALEDVKTDLGILSAEGFLAAIGAGDNIASKKIAEAMGEGKSKSIEELAEAVQKLKKSESFTEFQKLKAARIVNLAKERYPKLFNGENNVEEISKSWSRGIGRTSLVLLKDLDAKQKLFIANSVVKGILYYFKKQGKTNALKSMIFFPEIEEVLEEQENPLFEEIVKLLIEGKEYGIGYGISTQRESNLPSILKQESSAFIGIISRNDAGVRLKGKKQYRLYLRPTLSERIL